MARIETDPNYTTPTFSRATAATDLFKATDVQQLAAAMSTHDHTSGKGLVLPSIPASAIPDGAITLPKLANGSVDTSKIVDGSISTVDIADGAVSTPKLAPLAATNSSGYFQPNASSTTSPTAVPVPGASTTIAIVGGVVLIWAQLPFSVSAAPAVVGIYIRRGAGGWNQVSAQNQDVNGAANMAGGWVQDLSVPAGTHTYEMGFSTSAGTVTANAGALAQLMALELRR